MYLVSSLQDCFDFCYCSYADTELEFNVYHRFHSVVTHNMTLHALTSFKAKTTTNKKRRKKKRKSSDKCDKFKKIPHGKAPIEPDLLWAEQKVCSVWNRVGEESVFNNNIQEYCQFQHQQHELLKQSGGAMKDKTTKQEFLKSKDLKIRHVWKKLK